ncbi:MAG: hypothetical protein IKH75_19500 [Ruminococcus sp.]|nr:hypothetical protein [Ruminococcus sp.]
MIYYVGIQNQIRQTAGAKAPTDIMELCDKRGYHLLPITLPNEKWPKIVQNIWKYKQSIKFWKSVTNILKNGDILIYQHPLYVGRLLHKYINKMKSNGVHLIVLIHDLETLRKGIEGAVNANESANQKIEGSLFKKFDSVICHNEKMKKYMINQGYSEKQLVSLEIFDYLHDCPVKEEIQRSENASICIAGNLLKTKSGYIYHIHDNGNNPELDVNCYGLSFDTNVSNKNLIYHGSFPSAELPRELTSDFGLVWDGPEASSCVGNIGEYLKYNNPHKASLYLSSGLPIIVWDQAAIADFVVSKKVGFTIANLKDLQMKIDNISEQEYEIIKKNTIEVSKLLRNGYFFYKALDQAISNLKNREA